MRLYKNEENRFDIVRLFVKKYDREDNFEKYIYGYLVICSLDHVYFICKKKKLKQTLTKKRRCNENIYVFLQVYQFCYHKNISVVSKRNILCSFSTYKSRIDFL